MSFLRFVSLIGFLLWANPVLAQTATPDAPYRVLVIGDAMSAGMGAGLERMAAAQPRFEIVNRFNEISAIARPDRYDWAAAIPKMIEGKNIAAVVVLTGLNDRQDIRTPTSRLAFNSREWVAAYKTNLDAILDVLKAQNVKIIWLGQPPMGDAAYDADMQIITAMQQERVLAKGGMFVDLRQPFLGPDGKYSDRGPDENGEDHKLRQSDGVVFLRVGNNRLGQIALAAVVGAGGALTPVAASPAAQPLAPLVQSGDLAPMFGQQDSAGGAILHPGRDVVASMADKKAATSSSIGIAALKDSAADKLFTQGAAANAPVGRFDDFSYVAPPAN